MKNNDVSVPPKWDNRACDSLGDIIHQQWNPSKNIPTKAAILKLRCQQKSREDNRFTVEKCMTVCSIGKYRYKHVFQN